MGHDPFLESLRRAAGKPDVLLPLLGQLPNDALQQIGDAVLATLDRQPNADLGAAVDRLIGALDEREWDGDTELIAALNDATGRRPSQLPVLRLELDDLADALRQAEGSDNHLDLQSGFVWQHTLTDAMDDPEEDLDDETRWLFVMGEGPSEAYRDLQHFISTLPDARLVDRLNDAIAGRGAFRRFRSVLERENPAEYTRWHRFDADARIGHARSWLAMHGYQARPTRHDLLA